MNPHYHPIPAHRTQVEAMAGFGIAEADIAGVLEIDVETLRKHFPRELKSAHVKANARVAENLFRKATGEGREAVTAAIFWLKTRAGWKETAVHELGGSAGMPVVFRTIYEHPPVERTIRMDPADAEL